MMKHSIKYFVCLFTLLQPLLGAYISDTGHQNEVRFDDPAADKIIKDVSQIDADGIRTVYNYLQQADPCSDYPCQRGGKCTVVPPNDIKCDCVPPFSGNRCEKDPCNTDQCINGATCTLVGAGFKCNCKKGFGGTFCELECDCENGDCRKDDDGNIVCYCLPEFGIYTANKCKACNCGINANCTYEKKTLKDKKTCICPLGTIEEGGTCIGNEMCGVKPCKHGICVRGTTSIQDYCRCQDDYTAFYCDEKKGDKKTPVGLIVGLCIGIPLIVVASFLIYRYVRNRRQNGC